MEGTEERPGSHRGRKERVRVLLQASVALQSGALVRPIILTQLALVAFMCFSMTIVK